MTMMLASVRSLDEALFALEAGADLIDLKEPSHGALGALDHAAVRVCVQAIGGRRPVSATIGDIPSMEPHAVTARSRAHGRNRRRLHQDRLLRPTRGLSNARRH